jgi:hypothetical protein
MRGIEVVRVRNSTWHARVLRGLSGIKIEGAGAHSELIPSSIRAGFSNGPQTSNEHERDAGGILLYGVIPAESLTVAEVREKRPHSPPTPEAKAIASEKRLAKKTAERAAAGCSCPKTKHSRGCPLYGAKSKLNPLTAEELAARDTAKLERWNAKRQRRIDAQKAMECHSDLSEIVL